MTPSLAITEQVLLEQVLYLLGTSSYFLLSTEKVHPAEKEAEKDFTQQNLLQQKDSALGFIHGLQDIVWGRIERGSFLNPSVSSQITANVVQFSFHCTVELWKNWQAWCFTKTLALNLYKIQGHFSVIFHIDCRTLVDERSCSFSPSSEHENKNLLPLSTPFKST